MNMKENTPEIWADIIPHPKEQDHKYSRGQVVVTGGQEMTGAACLAADAAARAGAGLVNIVVSKRSWLLPDPLTVYRSFRPYIIARRVPDIPAFIGEAGQKGRVVSVIGPGLGNKSYGQVRRLVLDILAKGKDVPAVIDADGLNAFAGSNELFGSLHENSVITPHEGEFKRLFPEMADVLKKDRIDAAMQAAEILSGGVLVLKGHKTIIAVKGRMLVNKVASPYLATAGSGDVLAGLIAGLMAQGMPAFEAAAAGVWIHGKAAQNVGAGLVAEDLTKNIPSVLKEILGI